VPEGCLCYQLVPDSSRQAATEACEQAHLLEFGENFGSSAQLAQVSLFADYRNSMAELYQTVRTGY